MTRPLIAISTRPRQAGQVKGWGSTPAAVAQYTYLESIWRAGCDEAMVAPRMRSVDDAASFLRRVDGLVLVGGGDIDPARFGQVPHPEVYDIEPASDELETSLALAAVALGVPMLAICRGMQVLNVALGGTLHQHITREPGFGLHGDPREGEALHPVEVEPGSLLSKAVGGATSIGQCWSYHHQAVDALGRGLIVSARSDDGTPEAVEFADASSSWMLAVQWHPERTAHRDAAQQSLFDELARQASARSRLATAT
jgi:putative glutamine amidotransferase